MAETLLDVFVTGTDDGVGKTYVCALLAARAREAGLTPAMLTAVQVGDDDATRWLIRRVPGAVGATAHAYPVDAARGDAGDATDSVDPEHVREVYLALRERSDGVLVEGPSGLLAPLGDGRTTADLAQALGLPLVIICRPDRGTVNHVALTLEAALSRNLAVRGLIVNGASERPGLEELANRTELARLAPILEIVPDETVRSLST
ncbi:MAG: dethiobiotin synthetase [Gaiellales bacterium]|nr:dethiobiotin synthetase [Gaiellales bacterium]